MIPYGRQDVSEDDIAAVCDVLRSDFLTQGSAVPAFERAVAAYTGSAFALAVSNATAALHLACLALGLSPSKRLWTSPITFVASANCARYCGAEVDFVDIDARTYNICPNALAEKLALAECSGTLPDIVVAVHFAGQPCAMREIGALSKRYGFAVIEDASHAIGAEAYGIKVGACTHSDAVVFSFHPVKLLTTGEGGMVLTNSPDLARRIDRLRSHGITRAPEDFTEIFDDVPQRQAWHHEQIELGFNYRLTDIQAALGLSQLKRLDQFLDRRRQLARAYDELLRELDIVTPYQAPESNSAYHLYPIWIDPAHASGGRAAVFKRMRDAGVGVQVHYIPVHLQPYYRQLGFKPGDYPKAEAYFRGAFSLPLFTRLTGADQLFVVDALRRALQSEA